MSDTVKCSLYSKKYFLAFAVCSLMFGCAASKEKPIVWPNPPDAPRIKFIKNIYSGKDVFGASYADILIGGQLGGGGFRKPMGVHVDKNGNLYVTDTGFGVVHIINFKEQKVEGLVGLSKPINVVTDSKGKSYVTDTGMDRVMVYNEKGEYITTIGNPKELKQPSGIAINEKLGRLYVVDTHNHNVAVYSLKTRKRLFEFSKRGAREGELNFPSNVIIDDEDRLWVVDTINGRVQSFDADGNYLDSFGRLGDAPGSFSRPKGIAMDSEGHIYVVDSAFNNIQIFDKEGQILLVFGSYGSGNGQMILPAGIDIDKDDKIYVSDQWNNRISVFQFISDRYKSEHKGEMKELFKGVDIYEGEDDDIPASEEEMPSDI